MSIRAFTTTALIVVCVSSAFVSFAQTEKRGVSLFNGRDLTGWHLRNPTGPNGWKIQNGVYVNTPPSTDIQTDAEYYDFQLHVEFNVSEGDGNSGVYLRDKYEVQILNSYGKPPEDSGCGA